MKGFAAVAAVFLLFSAPLDGRIRPAGKVAWKAPRCSEVSGTGGVTFTRDEGATLAPTSEVARPVVYTYGLIATDVPNELYALHGTALIRSADAGCSWSEVAQVTGWDFPPQLVAGGGGKVYGWSDHRDFFFEFENGQVLRRRMPYEEMVALVADPHNGDHLRAADVYGERWDSFDGGEHWTFVNTLQPRAPVVNRVAFDPRNFDHMVAGTRGGGVWVSFDGGASWVQAASLGDRFNVFSVVVSPVDSNVVWARAIDLTIYEDPTTPTRHLYRSTDGGRSFVRFLTDSTTGSPVSLTNQPLLVPHPSDPNVLYFPFGTFFQDYGTEIWRYDAALHQLTKTTNHYDEVVAIIFNPGDSSVMYLGIAEER